ncbi:PREDICTED: uncharacterized protein LOC109585865 [Amphimedon queenslandica]|uniref:Uncharacterized protein n=1 Tax=Amphimedon queenslandica TaxID=400682 RepID=A0A1X7TV88_AMPQE|nr:PREDICTED: uncharacterized protein LOC109585865 [Amphimedon queenslandica]|eukprot:XP_019857573.1 PREDICTED: uncharacterized protein LOC109585865 [Amphimedon queenslandica]
MAGLAKTNDAGDDSVTQWLWVDSKHKDHVLKHLVSKKLIDEKDTRNPQTLSYFKVTTKRENVEKIQDAIRDMSTVRDMNTVWFPQGMSYPTEDCTPKARLASTTPLAAKLDDDSQPATVTIELTYTYGCLDGTSIEPIVAELIKRLKTRSVYKSEEFAKGVVYKVTVNESPREFVFMPALQHTPPIIIVSADIEGFCPSKPDAENDVYEIDSTE